jgi:peptidoglycan/LPS O-acetylase OafA/YrhL
MHQQKMRQTEARRDGYIPSLDGWRAIAVCGVLFAHSLTWSFRGHSLRLLQETGGLGVVLFFAISGFLITTRIVQEELLCGHFDLKGFYIRRFFRIQPAALLYLSGIALLTIVGAIYCDWHFWIAAMMMYQNFAFRGIPVDPPSFFVGHFWTLAVEEHFYIFLSLLLFTIRRYRWSVLCLLYLLLTVLQVHQTHYIVTHPWVMRRTWWQIRYLLFPAMIALAL